MSNRVKLACVAMLVAGAIWGEQIIKTVKDNVDIVTPSVVTPDKEGSEPDLALKDIVKNIVATDIAKEDASQLSDFFNQLADVVQNDPGFIKTTAVFREFNMTAGGLNFAGTDLKNKYPNLGEEIDAAIIASIGVESSTLDAKKREDLVKCLKAIAWATQQ